LLFPKESKAADAFEEQSKDVNKEAIAAARKADREAIVAAADKAREDAAAAKEKEKAAEEAEGAAEAAALKRAAEAKQREQKAADAAAAREAKAEQVAALRKQKEEEKQAARAEKEAVLEKQIAEEEMQEYRNEKAREDRAEWNAVLKAAKQHDSLDASAKAAGESEGLVKEQTCEVWADPHVSGFDNNENQGPVGLSLLAGSGATNVFGLTFDQREKRPMDVNTYATGDYWLVLHEDVHIQARQRLSGEFKPDRAAIGAVAVGGPFMKGHRFIVEPADGQVLFDDGTFEMGEWSFENEFVSASQDGNGVVEAVFPMGVKLTARRLNKHVDLRITMTPLAGKVDGECGNYDGISENDDEKSITERMGDRGLKITDRSQLLFAKAFEQSETMESEIAAQAQTEVEEMTKGCDWDCYLERYPRLRNDKWETEKGNIDYAQKHFIQFGYAAGKNCKCDSDLSAAGEVWSEARRLPLIEDKKSEMLMEVEQATVVAQAEAEADMLNNCDWRCYVNRYPKLKNEKWEKEKGNLDYAQNHFVKFGHAAGKDCQCGDRSP